MILSKHYKDKTIDYIVTDILSKENYAIIRRFNNNKKLVSIGIWILDWYKGRGNLRSVATNNPFEANRTEKNARKNSNKNNSFEANRAGKDAKKNSNENNPFVTQGK